MNMQTFDRHLSSSSSTRVTLFVAVNKEVRESESVLRWALDNLERLGGTEICILHVHRPEKRAYTGTSISSQQTISIQFILHTALIRI